LDDCYCDESDGEEAFQTLVSKIRVQRECGRDFLRALHQVLARRDLEECMLLVECNANRCMASAGEAYEWLKRLNGRLEPVCNEEAGNG
jgi:hypothetical protein